MFSITLLTSSYFFWSWQWNRLALDRVKIWRFKGQSIIFYRPICNERDVKVLILLRTNAKSCRNYYATADNLLLMTSTLRNSNIGKTFIAFIFVPIMAWCLTSLLKKKHLLSRTNLIRETICNLFADVSHSFLNFFCKWLHSSPMFLVFKRVYNFRSFLGSAIEQ